MPARREPAEPETPREERPRRPRLALTASSIPSLLDQPSQVPLDGVVVHGSALVSIQHITGEALPVTKRVGDEVPAGERLPPRLNAFELLAMSGGVDLTPTFGDDVSG